MAGADQHHGAPALERAAFVVSIDTEMAWGLNHRPEQTYRYHDERPHMEQLLAMLDRHQLPATWAVVGHLMLDQCAPVNGVKHPEIVRPTYDWFEGDWFANDPCGAATGDSTWYAPDLVARIRAADTAHEIASHGFSHIVAGDPGCSREAFSSELAAAVKVAADQGLTLRSLVHPRNRIGHVDVLVDHGIIAYRGRPAPTAAAANPLARLADQLVDKVAGSERTAVRPRPEGPIWNLPATIMFDVDSRPRTWRLWIRQVERRLTQATRHRSLFHLWFHPHNFRDHPEASFEAFDRVCRAAVRHRERGLLDTVTMGALAGQLSARTH